ncbi:MAG: hypothetical protein WAW88_04355, partial [Nocardioides sp.]
TDPALHGARPDTALVPSGYLARARVLHHASDRGTCGSLGPFGLAYHPLCLGPLPTTAVSCGLFVTLTHMRLCHVFDHEGYS